MSVPTAKYSAIFQSLDDSEHLKVFVAPFLSRAARGLLDWTQQELADAARIGASTVRLFEGEAAERVP